MERRKKALIAELTGNLNLVTSLWNYLSADNPATKSDTESDIIARTVLVRRELKRVRYTYYFQDHKSVFYSLALKGNLAQFL